MVSIPVLLGVGRITEKEKKKKRSRQELSNEDLIAKIGADTPENELSRV